MNILHHIFDFILHLDKHIAFIFSQYGIWAYILLFLVIFCETGLVIFPFLPGDSVLFALGLIAANHIGNLGLLTILLVAAAVLGNTTNYWIGRLVGPKVFKQENSIFFNAKYLESSHNFFDKYGAGAIILGRFIPIFRTFVPFVAGIGAMNHAKYQLLNILSALLWVCGIIYVSYFFSYIPWVRDNFTAMIFIIIGVSLTPVLIKSAKHLLTRAN